MEVGAVPTLTSHAAAAQDYPEVQAKLNEHVDVTRRHAYLIEGCIKRLGDRPSALKEAVGSVMGKVTGVANLPAKDTVVKNALGDYAAENFEIACYKSLIAAAEKVGDLETAGVCGRVLRDEEEMAGWLGGHIATLTQAFLAQQAGENGQASHGDTKQTAVGLGPKGKELASNVGTKGALLASGALLAGAGAALLIGQALRRSSTKDQVSKFEHSTSIDASPDEVFDFMAKVENLPRYLPTTHAAQPQEGERVRVQGEAQGHKYDSDGYFRADSANHRIEWGADERYYSGWLQVKGQGDGSRMTVHLSFSGGPPAGLGKAPGEGGGAPSREQVQEGLVTALESIKNFVEEGRSGGKEEPSAAT